MGTESSKAGSAAEASTTLGVGGTTSGQQGATPSHETQAETGGSGGEQLTHSHGAETAAEKAAKQAAKGAAETEAGPDQAEKRPTDSAVQSGARGAQDTRAQQAGGTGTGLGSPESGANQSEGDLPPGR